jgi:hypothetical protein
MRNPGAMPLNRDESDLVSERETILTPVENNLVNEVFYHLFIEANFAMVPTAKDDRVAKLEAALIGYIIASRA